ncbi:unnamed protein product [Notodromas monacha]|uniref:Uncharacterized protein n=1 Tax=Notodromas monacha TaxID=399045 RepID=A0A7R9GCQ9_9CRUS|nr:unnamed protein product [Notodromas monacha]CAG0916228.1 unnamed protein product [Notodromas monacha]
MIMETTVVTLLDVPKVREELAEFGIHCVLLRNVLTLWELGAQDPEPIITVARRNKQVTAIICQQGDTTDEGPSWYQMLTPNSKPNLDLKQMLQKFVDWKKIQLCFANVPFLMKETLYAVAAENNVHLLSVESSTEDHPALYTPSPKLPSSQQLSRAVFPNLLFMDWRQSAEVVCQSAD